MDKGRREEKEHRGRDAGVPEGFLEKEAVCEVKPGR
jgi:hypothetical protein